MESGGARRVRTTDLFHAMQALSQLSYGPLGTAYAIEYLTPDTNYFAATAFNAAGMVSSFSKEAVKTLN